MQACGTGAGAPDPDPDPTEEPVTVDSTLPTGQPGEAGEEYSFTFVYNENLAEGSSLNTFASNDEVVFHWVFGDGTPAGEATVTVDANGIATYEVKHTYQSDGRYGLVLTVEDENKNVLAQTDFIVEIGEVEEEHLTLDACDGSLQFGGTGGYGVTIDRWNISVAPAGATFDIEYNTYSIPDKLRVEYPEGTTVLDTGWRGSTSYDGNPLYPGGIEGPGYNEEADVFTKASADEFVVTVLGPGAGTAWDYYIRCTP